mgnify:FL=1
MKKITFLKSLTLFITLFCAVTFGFGQCSTATATWNGSEWSWSDGTTTNTLPTIGATLQVVIDGPYNTGSVAPQGSFSACNLTISSTGSLTIADNSYVEVENNLTVGASGSIDVQPYGAFVQNDDSSHVINNGTMSVDKITAPMDAWYEYTYWSSPVEGETFENAINQSEPSRRYIFSGQNFLDATAEVNNDGATDPGQDDIDDDGDAWQWVSGSTEMIAGVGYATTMGEDFFIGPPMGSLPYEFRFTFTGDFHNGPYEVPIYRNDSELDDNNWNMIGNPYPSAIDVDLFFNVNVIDIPTGNPPMPPTGAIDGTIYLWSQNAAPSALANGSNALNFSDSDYAVINGASETAGGDGILPERFIPSGQAFFVSMSNDAVANLETGTVYSSDVIFRNNMRVANTTANSQFFKNTNSKGNAKPNKLWINLTSNQGAFNQTAIAYVEGATNNFDGTYFDAPKPSAIVTAAILYTNIDGSNKKFTIQGKAEHSINQDEIISLGFKTNTDVSTLLTLSIDHLEGDFLTGNTIYLKDNLLNTLHDLSASNYTFTSDVGEFNTRFEIVFSANALSVNDIAADANALKISELQDDQVQFSTSNNLSIKSVRIYDLLGRQLYNLRGNRSIEVYNLSNLSSAVFIAKIELSNGAIITKKAIKK